MFSVFRRKSPIIEFFTTDWSARSSHPIKLAKDCLPPYWKYIPTTACGQDTVKKCPGITDWLTAGYIISAWSDIDITQSDEYGTNAVLRNGTQGAGSHPPEQCSTMLNQKSNYHGTVKLPCKWMIKTRPGWSIMIVPLWYWKDQPWEALPGIIHSDNHHCEVNLNFVIKSNNEKFTITAGTPLAQIIPFKREEVTGVSRATTDIDLKRHSVILKLYTWTKNGVGKFYKRKSVFSLKEKDLDFEKSLKYPIED